MTKTYFDPARETATGDGWVLISWDNDDAQSAQLPTIAYYATLTALHTAQTALFSAADEVIAYFSDTAAAAYVASNQATVDTDRDSLMTAEGLTPPP